MSYEAIFSFLLLFLLLFSIIPPQGPGLEKVILYKQASDLTQIVLKEESFRNPERVKELARSLGPGLKVNLKVEDSFLVKESPEYKVTVKRHFYENGELKNVKFSLGL